MASKIENALKGATKNRGIILDTVSVFFPVLDSTFYAGKNYRPVWSDNSGMLPLSDSLVLLLGRGLEWGLFPDDYNYSVLKQVRTLLQDSTRKGDESLLAAADILCTDAFMRLARELKQGRLMHDSLSWINKKEKHTEFFIPMLEYLFRSKNFSAVIDSLQPKHEGYQSLRRQMKTFLDSMDRREYTHLIFPWIRGNTDDSVRFLRTLMKRLGEEGMTVSVSALPDSAGLAELIVSYQKKNGISADGRIGRELVGKLNDNDFEKYRRLAITLDRYKELPEVFPEKYIFVNLPEFKLYVHGPDSLLLESRIICGRPSTPTPVLTSGVSELVVMPTWTVPASIVKKELLPGLKKNAAYLTKKGMHLLDMNGQRVRADSINWNNYSNNIPFRIRQPSGDNNALGLMKFNFESPSMIYLHDTDNRGLFKNSRRAISHGCVRVQEWQKLAALIVDNDSAKREPIDSFIGYKDSINNWISIKKRRTITIKNHFPLYIRYFGCGVRDGRLVFFEDIYRKDSELSDRYFRRKKILPYL